jgi:hypothetical protein
MIKKTHRWDKTTSATFFDREAPTILQINRSDIGTRHR